MALEGGFVVKFCVNFGVETEYTYAADRWFLNSVRKMRQ